MSNRSALGEYVYTDVEFRQYRRRRALRLLHTGVGFLLAYAMAWSVVALTRGDWLTLILQGVSVCGGAWVWFCLCRGQLGLAGHSYFCIVIPVVAGMIALEGVTGPFLSMSHYHLLPLIGGAYLLFFEHGKRGRRVYVSTCLMIFVSVELGLLTWPALGLAYPPDAQGTGRWILSLANFASLIWVARIFVADLAEAEKQLAGANARMEALLENMLPLTISQRLRREGRTFADAFGECSVLFADIVGYTALSESVPNVVGLLDAIFTRFDDLTEQSGLEKIKTIGDAYMVAAGIPVARPDHAIAAAKLALRMQTAIKEFPGLEIRIGINSGAVVAGVIGKKRFIYDLWGDTVNIAARMESQGISGEIQISDATHALLPSNFICEDRGEIAVKGKGRMRVYLLKGCETLISS
ncbi:MAG: adenylate/guanylate cyclase domain-containing protein [Candidatus Accumulibacter sp.]|uniref:adenylate/guanylate cyclase domain-containing protein n=1 Tax=Accumulibacter sp. TaxID=2053492 RepID=UPI001AD44F1A|nr:adenylate/guanylate cyclase domain-containing protein [Accumulibacter sp.]MBN8517321.1 adenylate/guanylate cyclase domain-containing protein [Accumulibacter sp.]MBO3710865.1 adenylate/guanylate cyclase domain-containing protein [Accumulibacter sp.]